MKLTGLHDSLQRGSRLIVCSTFRKLYDYRTGVLWNSLRVGYCVSVIFSTFTKRYSYTQIVGKRVLNRSEVILIKIINFSAENDEI